MYIKVSLIYLVRLMNLHLLRVQSQAFILQMTKFWKYLQNGKKIIF